MNGWPPQPGLTVMQRTDVGVVDEFVTADDRSPRD